jgi:hypothetical protein
MKKHESDDHIDDLVQKISAIAEGTKILVQHAVIQYSCEVDSIINNRVNDTQHIELCLTYMLDFCFDERILSLYKKLCRYYYSIDPDVFSYKTR